MLLALAVCLAGCSLASESGVVRDLLVAVGKTHVTGFVAAQIGWSIGGGLLGLALALGAFFALRAAGAYRWQWKHASWFRAFTLVGMLCALPVAGCVAGYGEGFYRGLRGAIRQSPLGTEVLPAVGDFGADLAAFVDVMSEQLAVPGSATDFAAAWVRVTAFQSGGWELDVGELRGRLARLPAPVVRAGTDMLKLRLLSHHTSWQGGGSEHVLDWVLPRVVGALLPRGVDAALDGVSGGELSGDVHEVLDGLTSEAARHGDPRTIARAELSAYLVDDLIVPLLLSPVRQVVRHLQRMMLLLALTALLSPLVFFRIAETLRKKTASP